MDSTAALGIVKRKGCGKLRHVKVGSLWIQEKAERGELDFKKIKGTENPADLMTKYVQPSEIHKYMHALNQDFREGRASLALELSASGHGDDIVSQC